MLTRLSSWLQLVLYGFSHQVILAKEPQSLAWYVMDVAWGSGTPHQPISMQASLQDQITGTPFSFVAAQMPSHLQTSQTHQPHTASVMFLIEYPKRLLGQTQAIRAACTGMHCTGWYTWK